MKIQRIQLFPIASPRQTGIANQHVIVKLETADGAVGWGEMSDLSHVPMYQFDLPELERMLNELLGGKLRDRMRVCYPIFRMRSVEEVGPNLERVEEKLQLGFDLIRVYVGAN